ncbi:Gti1/Pac2 family-domain-containing protein, partial [Dimargaris cristalligena]
METYYGYIETGHDALLLFEACRQGRFSRVQRRLSDKERSTIRSGSIFVWDEEESGMRRWTDGKTWSPSRVLGCFLTYQELETKRRSIKASPTALSVKNDGLVKKSLSLSTYNGHKLHLICYYSKRDVQERRLRSPSMDPQFTNLVIPHGYYPEMTP